MKQFYVKSIHILTADTTHAKKGTVIANGADGWYIYRHTFGPSSQAACWPKPTKKGIQLHRDYWKYLGDHDADTPYMQSFMNAEQKQLR